MKVDLTGVDAWSGGVMISAPFEGIVQVDDASEGKSTGGYDQIELELRVVEGPQEGGTIRDWIVVTPSTLGKVKQVLEAFGADGLDSEVEFDPTTLIGKRCRIVVREEPYNGEMKTRVKAYQPAGAGAATDGAAQNGGKDDKAPLAF